MHRVKDDARGAAPEISRGLIALIAFACGAMVANIYHAHTLIERIGPEIGLLAALSRGPAMFLLASLVTGVAATGAETALT